MLGAPPLNGVEDDGYVDGSEDRDDGAYCGGLAGRGEAARHQVGDVEQPEEQERGEACVPGPPDAPGGFAPKHAGGEADGEKDKGQLGGGDRQGVGGEGGRRVTPTQGKKGNRGGEVDVREDQAHGGRGDVPIEDTLHVAHGGFGGGDEEGQVEAVGKNENRGHEPQETEDQGGLRLGVGGLRHGLFYRGCPRRGLVGTAGF